MLINFKNNIKKNKNKNRIFIIEIKNNKIININLLNDTIWDKKFTSEKFKTQLKINCINELEVKSFVIDDIVSIVSKLRFINWFEYDTIDKFSIPVLNTGCEVFSTNLLKLFKKYWYIG